MRLGKAMKVGAVVAGIALLAIGAWISCNSGGSTEKVTKKSKARRGTALQAMGAWITEKVTKESKARRGTALQAMGAWITEKVTRESKARRGTALQAMGAWITEKVTKESKARRGSGSGREGDKDDKDQGQVAGLILVAAIAGAALWALRPPSPGSDNHRRVDGGGGGDRIRPNSSSLGGSNRNLVVRSIKIMSYNIWCREDMAVHERMKAIGWLVDKHSPDVIFFQEVTPSIHKIFQSFKWWKAYEHSILPRKANKLQFCMLLSKLPVNVSCCTRFENSMLGRDLQVACIKVEMGKELVVATSHLKRPNPPHDTHSTERVAQAKKALSFLDLFPNAVFGGDMNWDENSDGPFPLLHGWVDAWPHLRPREDGCTFDTESNQMLRGRRPLQKRLDRFVCKLKDFKLTAVDIIGTEAIPGVFSCNDNREIVPTLPSDHYGLLLTVSYVT